MLTGRHIAFAVILGIAVVFGLAGWRYFSGENQNLSSAKPLAPIVTTDTSTSVNQLEGTQQLLVDDLQVLQGRVSALEAEIKRL